mgnify:CR=1 FL=1
MNIDSGKIRKIIIFALPLIMFFWIGNKISFAYRTVTVVGDISVKAYPFIDNLGNAVTNPLPSLHPYDVLIGAVVAGITKIVIEYKKKHRKKFAEDKEYGSARWGNEKDIEPYIDKQVFSDNVILTQSERLTMGKPKSPKYARNQNVLVIGSSGSGKTRFYVKPNIMQMHSSYVTTDPKGTILNDCGKLLLRGKPIYQKGEIIGYQPYKIKIFNTIDFKKSMHYNRATCSSLKRRRTALFQSVL